MRARGPGIATQVVTRRRDREAERYVLVAVRRARDARAERREVERQAGDYLLVAQREGHPHRRAAAQELAQAIARSEALEEQIARHEAEAAERRALIASGWLPPDPFGHETLEAAARLAEHNADEHGRDFAIGRRQASRADRLRTRAVQLRVLAARTSATTEGPRPRGAGRPRRRVATTAAASSGDDPGPGEPAPPCGGGA